LDKYLIAENLLKKCLELYPNGALFKIMEGRLARNRTQLQEAIRIFGEVAEVHKSWVQMHQMCVYELGWCHALSLNFQEAAQEFGTLVETTSWSPCFYAYLAGVSMVEAGVLDEADRLLETATKLVKKNPMPLEEFALRRIEEFQRNYRLKKK